MDHNKQPKNIWVALAGLFTLFAIILVWWTLGRIKVQTRLDIGNSLQAVLETTQKALNLWERDQKEDISQWVLSQELREIVQAQLEVSRNPQALLASPMLRRLRTLFEPTIKSKQYQGFFIIAPDLINIASMRDANVGAVNLLVEYENFLHKVFKGKVIVSKPLYSDVPLPNLAGTLTEREPTMFVASPIWDDAGTVIAALTFRIDPAKTFTQLTHFDQLSDTGETYLFNKQGQMLSDSRFRDQLQEIGLLPPNERAILLIEVRDPGGNMTEGFRPTVAREEQSLTYMAARAVVGRSGLNLEGYRDYRGVPVVGAWIWDEELDLGLAVEVSLTDAYRSYNITRQLMISVVAFIIILYIGLFTGITRSRTQALQLAEEIRNSQTRIKSVVDNMVDGFITIDQSGIIESFNPAAERIFGYKASEIINQKINSLMPEPYTSEHDHYIQKYLDTGEARIIGFGREVIGLRRDGSTFPMDLAVSEMWIGRHRAFLGVIRDITDQKETEKTLANYAQGLEQLVKKRTNALNRALEIVQDAKDRTDGILKSVGDGLFVTDLENRVVLMNPAAEEILGIRFDEVFNRPIDLAIQEKTLRDQIKSILDKETVDYQFDFEVPGETQDHSKILHAHTSVIRDKAGKEIGIVVTMYDVTKEREVDRMKTEFVSTAAHELRTPLTSIQGFAELLLNKKNIDPEKKNRFLSHIDREAKHLARIIGDLLDISRIESGRSFSLDKNLHYIGDIITRLIPHFQENSDKHRFEVTLPANQLKTRLDEQKIQQVIENLLSNAVKYSPEGGVIHVVAESNENGLLVTISDQGIGMTPPQVAKIFDKFYRADASNTAVEGTGLGMTIVQYIVNAHGGKVWVESEWGKGTVAKFTIPTRYHFKTHENNLTINKNH